MFDDDDDGPSSIPDEEIKAYIVKSIDGMPSEGHEAYLLEGLKAHLEGDTPDNERITRPVVSLTRFMTTVASCYEDDTCMHNPIQSILLAWEHLRRPTQFELTWAAFENAIESGDQEDWKMLSLFSRMVKLLDYACPGQPETINTEQEFSDAIRNMARAWPDLPSNAFLRRAVKAAMRIRTQGSTLDGPEDALKSIIKSAWDIGVHDNRSDASSNTQPGHAIQQLNRLPQ
ncbi:hypothetical protein BDV95DRAFT_129460 [Massariosphaeria phaeospora]|uniref:Uncharacterized protein n=1 Tax=Massariosphaeria phaeospora TaxID=100035 RepID=A0A7C8MJ86_9PLEO|nr:hypothetical protein BDV95DRAFT_129460 [Massariosphaeria phaeospora]